MIIEVLALLTGALVSGWMLGSLQLVLLGQK